MPDARISLDDALELARTGDLWLFRGRTAADRAIQATTNSPVNHVGMAVVLDDLPPLLWHAELGKALPDIWAGTHHRGVQLHDLRAAVEVWARRYGQRAWLRQLEPAVRAEQEDAVLRTIARLDGIPFPSTARLASRWLHGRLPTARRPWPRRLRPAGHDPATGPVLPTGSVLPAGSVPGAQARHRRAAAVGRGLRRPVAPEDAAAADRTLETAYCAEVVAITYTAMGLLPAGRRPHWYDPGRFWSGDDLHLIGGFALGARSPSR